MRRVLAVALLLIVSAVIIWARSSRLVEAGSEWSHICLGPETLALGSLDSVENGYAVFTQEVQGKEDTQRVHLLRLADGQRSTIDPIIQVAEADQVNLYDVSVGKSGVVAVAANAILEAESTVTQVGLLLLYDTRGGLLSAHRLLEQGPILKLKVDDDNTIWAVSRGAKGADPVSAAFLNRYTELGETVSVVYTRATLPEIDLLMPYVRGVGSLGFGTTKENVYCWVPATQELIIMAKDGTRIRRVPLPAPRPADFAADAGVFRMFYTEGGTSIAHVRYSSCPSGNDSSGRPNKPATLFAYDTAQARWRELRYDLPPVALVGVDGERLILVSKWKWMTAADSQCTLDSSYQLFKP